MTPEQIAFLEGLIAEYMLGNNACTFGRWIDGKIVEAKKPKTKRIKMLAWYNGCALFWLDETCTDSTSKRVPAEDKEIEVPE